MPGLPVRPRPWPAPSSTAPDPDSSRLRPPGHPARVVEAQEDEAVLRGHPLPLGHGRVHHAHPTPPVDLRRHPEEVDHGRLDHAGVDGGHHQLTGVLSHHAAHRARGPLHELRPALAAGCDRHGRVAVPVGHLNASTMSPHSMPSASPGCSSQRSQRSRTGPSASAPARPPAGAAPPSRGPVAAPRSTAPSPRAALRSRRGGRPAQPPDSSQVGQARAALGPADDVVEVALRLAVADQHDPGRALLGREDPQDARLGPLLGRGSSLSPRLSGSLTPGFRRSAPAGAACGTRPRRRSGRRTPPRSNRPSPSSHAARG